jgi:hypothetical protein
MCFMHLVYLFIIFQKKLFVSEISGSHDGEFEDDLSSEILRRVVWLKLTDVSEVLTASMITLMMAVSTFETSVNFYQTTRCNIPEDSHLHVLLRSSIFVSNCRCEQLLSLMQNVTSITSKKK